jgi:hypothetical protein
MKRAYSLQLTKDRVQFEALLERVMKLEFP